MKLINTAEAGKIIGCHYSRIHTLIENGHLKDYALVKKDAKKHYYKLSDVEVREFNQHFVLADRGIMTRNNGFNARQSVKKVEPTYEEQIQSPIKSIGQRLEGIETRLNELNEQIHHIIKMWS